jgi:Zn finger protein HypA/HybF involved in hydrogenase expression
MDKRPADYKLSQKAKCTTCLWQGTRRELIWSRPRGYICPACYATTIEIEQEEAQ